MVRKWFWDPARRASRFFPGTKRLRIWERVDLRRHLHQRRRCRFLKRGPRRAPHRRPRVGQCFAFGLAEEVSDAGSRKMHRTFRWRILRLQPWPRVDGLRDKGAGAALDGQAQALLKIFSGGAEDKPVRAKSGRVKAYDGARGLRRSSGNPNRPTRAHFKGQFRLYLQVMPIRTTSRRKMTLWSKPRRTGHAGAIGNGAGSSGPMNPGQLINSASAAVASAGQVSVESLQGSSAVKLFLLFSVVLCGVHRGLANVVHPNCHRPLVFETGPRYAPVAALPDLDWYLSVLDRVHHAPTGRKVYSEAFEPRWQIKSRPRRRWFVRRFPCGSFCCGTPARRTCGCFTRFRRRHPTRADDIPDLIIPAFMVSELTTAFQMGLFVFVPMLIIDILMATVLMSLGMMMVLPQMISSPGAGVFLSPVAGSWLCRRWCGAFREGTKEWVMVSANDSRGVPVAAVTGGPLIRPL